MWFTSPLIHAQEWYPGTSSPGCYLTDIIHQSFQASSPLAPIIFLVLHYHTQVLRQLREILHIMRYKLWCTVMVLEQRDDFPCHKAVCASKTEKDAEEQGDGVVDGEVEERLDRTGDKLPLLGCALAAVTKVLVLLLLYFDV
jgi:hypothetical protein